MSVGEFAAGLASGAGETFPDAMQERTRRAQEDAHFEKQMALETKRFNDSILTSAAQRAMMAEQLAGLGLENKVKGETIQDQINALKAQFKATQNTAVPLGNAAVRSANAGATKDEAGAGVAEPLAGLSVKNAEEGLYASRANRNDLVFRQDMAKDAAAASDRAFAHEKEKFSWAKRQARIQRTDSLAALASSQALEGRRIGAQEQETLRLITKDSQELPSFAQAAMGSLLTDHLQFDGKVDSQFLETLRSYGNEMAGIVERNKGSSESRPSARVTSEGGNVDFTGGRGTLRNVDASVNMDVLRKVTGGLSAREAVGLVNDPATQQSYWREEKGILYNWDGVVYGVPLDADTHASAMSQFDRIKASIPEDQRTPARLRAEVVKEQRKYNESKARYEKYVDGRIRLFNDSKRP